MTTIARQFLTAARAIPPAVQVALAPEFRDLAFSPHLDPEAARALARCKLDAAAAGFLFHGASFDHETLMEVAASERRDGPLRLLLTRHADLVDDRVVAAMGEKIPPTGAGFALLSPHVSAATKRRVATRAKGSDRLEWIVAAAPAELADDELAAHVGDFAHWAPKSPKGRRAKLCALLVGLRPAVLPLAVAATQHDSLVTAAGGAHTLLDEGLQREIFDGAVASGCESYALTALAANPACAPALRKEISVLSHPFSLASSNARRASVHQDRPVEAVEDAEALTALVRRALPTQYRPAGRPALVVGLAHNPHLVDFMVERIAEELSRYGDWNVPDWALADARRALVAAYGIEPARVCPRPEPPVRLPHWAQPETEAAGLSAERIALALATPVPQLTFGSSWVFDAACTELGDDVALWRLVLSLVDSFEGSLGQLIEVARAAIA